VIEREREEGKRREGNVTVTTQGERERAFR
jgi:hypothetical protein